MFFYTSATRLSCRGQRGFSLVELLVTLAMLGIIVATAIPAYQAFRERSFDAVAESDLNNLIKGVYALQNSDTPSFAILWLGLTGPRSLPTPLREIKLSNGIRALWILRVPLFGSEDLIYLWVEHQNGGHSFRYLEFLDTRLRQKISRT